MPRGYPLPQAPPRHKTPREVSTMAAKKGLRLSVTAIRHMMEREQIPAVYQEIRGHTFRFISDEQAALIIRMLRIRRVLKRKYCSPEEILKEAKKRNIPLKTTFLFRLFQENLVPGLETDPTYNEKRYLIPRKQVFGILFRALLASEKKTPGFLTTSRVIKAIRQAGGNLSLSALNQMLNAGRIQRVAQYRTGTKVNWLVHESELPPLIEFAQLQGLIRPHILASIQRKNLSPIEMVAEIKALAEQRRGQKILLTIAEAAEQLGMSWSDARRALEKDIRRVGGQQFVSAKRVKIKKMGLTLLRKRKKQKKP